MQRHLKALYKPWNDKGQSWGKPKQNWKNIPLSCPAQTPPGPLNAVKQDHN